MIYMTLAPKCQCKQALGVNVLSHSGLNEDYGFISCNGIARSSPILFVKDLVCV